MSVWPKPPIYIVIHVISGMIAFKYPILLVAIVGYHMFQLAFGIRLFVFDGNFQKGNSVEHTALKLAEVGLGYALAAAIQYSEITDVEKSIAN